MRSCGEAVYRPIGRADNVASWTHPTPATRMQLRLSAANIHEWISVTCTNVVGLYVALVNEVATAGYDRANLKTAG